MPKKILIIFWGLPYFDGRCMNMMEQLLNQNHQVTVLGVGEKSETLKYKNAKINLIDNLEFVSRARWPLDSSAPFLKGPGIKI